MNDHVFTFCDATLHARPDGTLWWPDQSLLCVSDLHLGKSERIARRGGTLLPPYETAETLTRLATAIDSTQPAIVVCLGDSFDDLAAAHAATGMTRETVQNLQDGRTWIWIEGNHDPGPTDLGGTHETEAIFGPLAFRHIATQAAVGEVSGHYHPKAVLAGAGRRACFVYDDQRLIMPAFGAYTGGLSVRDDVFTRLMRPTALVVLTGRRATAAPLASCAMR